MTTKQDYGRPPLCEDCFFYIFVCFVFFGLTLRGHLFHSEAMITATHMEETIKDQKSTLKHTWCCFEEGRCKVWMVMRKR